MEIGDIYESCVEAATTIVITIRLVSILFFLEGGEGGEGGGGGVGRGARFSTASSIIILLNKTAFVLVSRKHSLCSYSIVVIKCT